MATKRTADGALPRDSKCARVACLPTLPDVAENESLVDAWVNSFSSSKSSLQADAIFADGGSCFKVVCVYQERQDLWEFSGVVVESSKLPQANAVFTIATGVLVVCRVSTSDSMVYKADDGTVWCVAFCGFIPEQNCGADFARGRNPAWSLKQCEIDGIKCIVSDIKVWSREPLEWKADSAPAVFDIYLDHSRLCTTDNGMGACGLSMPLSMHYQDSLGFCSDFERLPESGLVLARFGNTMYRVTPGSEYCNMDGVRCTHTAERISFAFWPYKESEQPVIEKSRKDVRV